ncbi:hypothetical protein CI610_02897 [invertebrate metagenome]|uniref:Uncharacterized protein n=1 Tax=invertebrate metagenome TaxID=1711999 RepID=A0A2H9T4M2_9ZZZZ
MTDQWIATQKALLPATEWQHITFTMPGELWVFFLFNRKLLGSLSLIAAKNIQTFAKDKGLLPVIFTALHTFGLDPLKCILCNSKILFAGITHGKPQWELHQYAKELDLAKPIP